MAVRAEVKIYNNLNETKEWQLEKEINFDSIGNTNKSTNVYKTEKMVDYEVINNKELTESQILDLNQLANVLSEFFDVQATVIVNNSKPCAAALAPTLEEAFFKTIDGDPLALKNCSIGFSKKIEEKLAMHLKAMQIKLVLAPEYEENALSILEKNNSITIVKLNTPLKEFKILPQSLAKITPFGTIYHQAKTVQLDKTSFNIMTKTKPTAEQIEDMVFAWNISKYTSSNSVIIAKDFKTSAIVHGFTSAVNAIEYALDVACENSKDAILVSEKTLPSQECIFAAAQGRIAGIIQPGGGDNDKKLVELANKYNIAMIFTGIKNYTY